VADDLAAAAVRNPVSALYDRLMWEPLTERFFGATDFFNWGYWPDGCASAAEACRNLVDRLVEPVRPGSEVLDVGCGKGAVARHLLARHPVGAVTGIDLTDRQLERCRQNAPGASFRRMSATALEFADGSFDDVLSIEAAFHFRDRRGFLAEAHRVLRPGGRLLASDVLNAAPPAPADAAGGAGREGGRPSYQDWLRATEPPENYLDGPAAYAALLTGVGFRDVTVTDATQRCAVPHFAQWERFLGDLAEQGQISEEDRLRRVSGLRSRLRSVRHYVLVTAVR
jgi:cyclopropane fatty-acyl-phospholipid synthase-like methyltransferase